MLNIFQAWDHAYPGKNIFQAWENVYPRQAISPPADMRQRLDQAEATHADRTVPAEPIPIVDRTVPASPMAIAGQPVDMAGTEWFSDMTLELDPNWVKWKAGKYLPPAIVKLYTKQGKSSPKYQILPNQGDGDVLRMSGKTLGSGSFGTVYMYTGMSIQNKPRRRCAVKMMKTSNEYPYEIPKGSVGEYNTLFTQAIEKHATKVSKICYIARSVFLHHGAIQVMELGDGTALDCAAYRHATPDVFMGYCIQTCACLLGDTVSLAAPDIKLDNIMYVKTSKGVRFRIIDVDGIFNNRIVAGDNEWKHLDARNYPAATFPFEKFAFSRMCPSDAMFQTWYAFMVTMLEYCLCYQYGSKNSPVMDALIHNGIYKKKPTGFTETHPFIMEMKPYVGIKWVKWLHDSALLMVDTLKKEPVLYTSHSSDCSYNKIIDDDSIDARKEEERYSMIQRNIMATLSAMSPHTKHTDVV